MVLSLSLVSPDFLAEIIQVKYFTILANQGQPIGVTTEKMLLHYLCRIVCLILVTTWTDGKGFSLVTIICSS